MNKCPEIHKLKEYPIFEKCSTLTLERIRENMSQMKVKKGTKVSFSYSFGIAFIKRGAMKIVYNSGKKEKIILLMKQGDVIGLNSLVNKDEDLYTAYALADSELCLWRSDLMEELMMEDKGLMLSSIRYIGKKTNQINDRIALLSSEDVKERLLSAIKEFKKEFGLNEEGYLNLSLTMNDWANYISAGINEVYAAFGELEERSLVKFE